VEGAKPCPNCYVIMYKYDGCDEMMCSCGHKFAWSTTSWPTLRDLDDREKKKEDKWTPQMRHALKQLTAMGFPINAEVNEAVEAANGDVDEALDMLL